MLILSLGGLYYMEYHSLTTLWRTASINFVFLIIQLLLVSVYFSVKNNKWTPIYQSLLGAGDILFLMSIGVYFSVLNYLFFYIVSLIVVLLLWVPINLFVIKQKTTIPLAGLQALCFGLFLIADWGLKWFNLTDDTWLLNLIAR
jgi:hypothetical protein